MSLFLSPVHRLPVELISYIFDISSVSPLILSSVNSTWRTLALSTPRLWSNISITIAHLSTTTINTTLLDSFLSLSRNSPLHILIDARDPDWDFSEPSDLAPDIDDPDFDPYIHPFRPNHMDASFDLILPHINRWRSLTVLTDTWSPMYAALARLSSPAAPSAPLLESLVLMRCNQFACYPAEFQPSHLKSPNFLPFSGGGIDAGAGASPLPRLRTLNLTGVHLDWPALPRILPAPGDDGGLRSLELSYHAHEVRPSLADFCAILSTCPALESLVVKASGPLLPEDGSGNGNGGGSNDDSSATSTGQRAAKISLPRLDDLSLGYVGALDGCRLLDLLDAPNVTAFALEDAAHPADPHDEDAGCLLKYLSTGVIDATSTVTTTSTGTESTESAAAVVQEKPVARRERGSGSDEEPLVLLPPSSSPSLPFPHLEDLTLTRVKACPGPFKAFFGALSGLQRLELGPEDEDEGGEKEEEDEMEEVEGESLCPCPELNELCARGARVDLDFVVGGTAVVPKGKEKEKGDVLSVLGTDVQVFRRESFVGVGCGVDDEDGEVDCYCCSRSDPYALGGAFNDPVFDEYYGARLMLSR